jgi:methionine-rich copper-binding protein CopC
MKKSIISALLASILLVGCNNGDDINIVLPDGFDKGVIISSNQKFEPRSIKAFDINGKDLPVDVYVDPHLNESPIPAGIYPVTYTVVDNRGNVEKKIQYVTVKTSTNNPNDTTTDNPTNNKPVLMLIGDNTINLSLNEKYKELGYYAIDKEDGDLTDKVVITNNIDISKAGAYKVYYRVIDKDNNVVTKNRIVNILSAGGSIIEDSKPTITLLGQSKVTLPLNQTYKDLGVVAIDKEDGDLTDKVKTRTNIDNNKPGVYTYIYLVTDSAGNGAEVNREVIISESTVIDNNVSNTPPTLTLIGNSTVNLSLNEAYKELGYIAIDKEDGDLTSTVTVTNNINNSKAGSYAVYYRVLDKDNNTVIKERSVNVLSKADNNISNNPPTLTLLDTRENINLLLGEDYKDPGYIAMDKEDGDLTSKVKINSNVEKDKIGVYTKYYTVIDSANNIVTKSKTLTYRKDDTIGNPTNNTPLLTLLGSDVITLSLNQEYKELGIIAIDKEDGDISDKVTITDNIDSSKAGAYSVFYKVLDKDNNIATKERTVLYKNIAENDMAPTITVIGDNPVTIQLNENYKELGVTAFDREDGDLSDKLIISNNINNKKVGAYQVVYKVVDSANHLVSANRIVNVVGINQIPTINLIGSSTVNYYAGQEYKELGATAYDIEDGDLTAKVKVTNDVQETVEIIGEVRDGNVTKTLTRKSSATGVYHAYYHVTDSAGNTGYAIREIIINPAPTQP